MQLCGVALSIEAGGLSSSLPRRRFTATDRAFSSTEIRPIRSKSNRKPSSSTQEDFVSRRSRAFTRARRIAGEKGFVM